jgi:regulation of enolase protein 1 (concanavalin A-like superfamily)
MWRQVTYVACIAVGWVLIQGNLAFAFNPDLDSSLIGCWKLDETTGTTASDSSPNQNNGTLLGGVTWGAGKFKGALDCDGKAGSYVDCGNAPVFTFQDAITVSVWVNLRVAPTAWMAAVAKGENAWRVSCNNTSQSFHFGVTYYTNANYSANGAITVGLNEWHLVTGTYENSTIKLYVDGVLDTTTASASPIGKSTTNLFIGENPEATGRNWNGLLDDVRIYRRALSPSEIGVLMAGVWDPVAENPKPANNQTDVPRDSVLSWTPGPYGKTHDVYLGTVFDDVNTASRGNTMGVQLAQGQDANTLDPAGLFAFGQTYYWRVDEVNAAPDSAIYKGGVWTFTSEPYGYPVKPVKATASSSLAATMGPDKTIDGSGLDSNDGHSTSSTQMWLSKKGSGPIWIQYDFDKEYRLYQMWVWNSNQAVEQVVGFGAKDVTIQYSSDAVTWTTLAGVPEFNQAAGEEGAQHDTTIDFGGVAAKYVKLTINSNWADSSKQAGLAEVRFFYIPLAAYGPTPATGSTGVAINGTLNWRPGRQAVKHQVYVSSDSQAVAQGTVAAKIVTDHSLSLGSMGLEYGRTYYWKVNEVNDAATPSTWEGDVWSLTVIDYAVVDDFETYTDTCNRIFFAWVDGYGSGGSAECQVAPSAGNGTGSTVGNLTAPFAEQAVVHGGKQSMPMAYDNSKSPFYSEATRDWSATQSWTGGGVNTLVVYLRGDAPGFIETSPGNILMNGMGSDIWNASDQCRFAYKTLSGDGSLIARVNGIGNTNEWAKAGVMIRETIDPASNFAFTAATPTASHGISFQRRTPAATTGANTDVASVNLPVWVKIARKGDTFTSQYSSDGKAWTDVTVTPAVTITMPSSVLIGLAVSSHLTGSACGASFSNVSTSGNVSGQWQTAEIGVAQLQGNTPETFYVAVQDSSGKTAVVSNPDPTIIATGTWQQWSIPLSQLTSSGVNVSSIKKMMVGVGDRNSPKAGGIGKLYIDDIRLTRVTTQ